MKNKNKKLWWGSWCCNFLKSRPRMQEVVWRCQAHAPMSGWWATPGGIPEHTHRLEGEASRRGESMLNCSSKARDRLRCRRSFSSSFWGKSSRTGVPGVLRGAFLGGGIENPRFDGEALRECPRVSEEQWFIVVQWWNKTLAQEPSTECFLGLKGAWGPSQGGSSLHTAREDRCQL